MAIKEIRNSEELEISLLGFLYEQPMHGYELYKEISDLSGFGFVWRVKMGHLYAMLHRLEENKWVEAKVTQAGNRPQRNQYSITSTGKAKFNEWLSEPVNRGRDFRIAFLLKMYFALQRGGKSIDKLINNQKKICTGWVDKLKDVDKPEEMQDFHYIVQNFRLTQINGYLQWLDWCLENIKSSK